MNVAEFCIERLENLGVGHVVGLPGDFILGFFKRLMESKKLKQINVTCENHAGFVADGYARVHGVGCVAVTYNVGVLKLCNAIAGAYAEKSPVIVIAGAPESTAKNDPYPQHHMVRSYECQSKMFKEITCAQAILNDPTTAGYEIDRVLEAMMHYKQPVYIELMRDIAHKPISYDVYKKGTPMRPQSDKDNLKDSIEEVVAMLRAAKNPVVLAGVEIARCRMGKELVKFIEANNLPVAATLLSKSVVQELHPNFVGVYAGSVTSNDTVRKMVEESDCLLVLGEVLTESTVGFRPNRLFEKTQMVTCTTSEGLKIRKHNYPNVEFVDFCNVLFAHKEPSSRLLDRTPKEPPPPFMPNAEAKVTVTRLFEKVNAIMNSINDVVIVADTGDALFGSADLTSVHEADTFLGPAVYLSMGFAIPAALGLSWQNRRRRFWFS